MEYIAVNIIENWTKVTRQKRDLFPADTFAYEMWENAAEQFEGLVQVARDTHQVVEIPEIVPEVIPCRECEFAIDLPGPYEKCKLTGKNHATTYYCADARRRKNERNGHSEN